MRTMKLIIMWILCLNMAETIENEKKTIQSCTFEDGNKQCKSIEKVTSDMLALLPGNSCVKTNCDKCEVNMESKVIHDERLINIDLFWILPAMNTSGTFLHYECNINGHPCECHKSKCNGDNRYCQLESCDSSSDCNCVVMETKARIAFRIENKVYYDPNVLNYHVCVNKNLNELRRDKRGINPNNVEFDSSAIEIDDFEISVNVSGLLIMRKDGMEFRVEITEPAVITIPQDFTRKRGRILVLLDTKTGKTYEKSFYITESGSCKPVKCIICMDAIYNFKCLPRIVSYSYIVMLIILTSVMIKYLKATFEGIVWLLLGLVKVIRSLGGLISIIIKFFWSLGKIVANFIRIRLVRCFATVRNIEVDVHRQAMLLAVLIFRLGTLTMVMGSCNNHQVIMSTVNECINSQNGTTCKISTEAEVTINNLKTATCLWFTNEHNDNLFSLKLSFEEVQCVWHTQREYYTFPVELRTINEVICPNENHCGWGNHCYKGKEFPSITEESLKWPGETNCFAADSGSLCFIIDAQPCHFYRYWLVPNFFETFQVKKILGKHCSAILKVTEDKENKDYLEQVSEYINHAGNTVKGVEIKVLGNLDQPELILTEKVIMKVGDPSVAFIDYASNPGRPIKGSIGDVQAQDTYVRNFSYDKEMVSCSFYKRKAMCELTESYLPILAKEVKSVPKSLISINGNKNGKLLPLNLFNHKFYIDQNENLLSSMTYSSPVKVSLSFNDMSINVKLDHVCPSFKTELITAGCYSCNYGATISFEANSNCGPGAANIMFKRIESYTKAINL